MFWFTIFILGSLCAIVAIIALVVWLGAALIQAVLTCAGRSLTGFADGHVLVALTYAILGGWFVYLVAQGLYLACSFITAVSR